MKKTLHKMTSIFLSVLFILTITPISTFASEITTAQAAEAKLFIESKGFYLGDIVTTTKTSNGVMLEVRYPNSKNTSFFEYYVLGNDKIIKIIEGNAEDTIVYKENGDVYLDGVVTNILTPRTALNNNSRGYVYKYFSSESAAVSVWGPFTISTIGNINDVLNYTQPIRSLTSHVLGLAIGACFGAPAAQFYDVASEIISFAATLAVNYYQINIAHTNFKDNTKRPSQYMTKGVTTYTACGRSFYSTYWEMATLN